MCRRRGLLRVAWWGGFILSLSAAVQAQTAADWLQAMHHAVHHLNYEGRVVYQVGSELEVMHLQHQGAAAGETEYLSTLSGVPHQIRRGRGVMHDPQGEDRVNQHILGMNCLFHYRQMAPYYRLSLGKQHRVADRSAQIVLIEPKDRLRFGRRLYLDQETKLPLRSVLLDHQKQPLAQTLFTQLTLNKAPVMGRQHAMPVDTPPERPAAAQRWQFAALPAGFAMQLHHYRPEEQRDHFIFSDGLSMMSLYIEPWVDGGLQGFSRQGATWILGARRYNQRITLLGKVPQETLQQMMTAVRPAP